MSEQLISIVIPTYNNGHFFHKLLTSLLNQSYKNWEAIIVDNNSNDSTLSIIADYNDYRFKVYQINNNGVIAKSRNFGIQKANGEWVAFLDSDDWWDSDKLKNCSKYFNLGYDLIYHKLEIVRTKKSLFKKFLYSRKHNKNLHKDLLINGNFIPNSSVVIKKQILNKAGNLKEDINMIGSEDYNLWLNVSKHTNNVKYISKRLGYYYINENGISQKNMTLCYENAIKEFINECTQSEIKLIKGHLAYMEARYIMKSNKNDLLKNLLLLSIKMGTYKIKLKSLYYLFTSSFN